MTTEPNAPELGAMRQQIEALRRILRYERDQRKLAELDAIRTHRGAGGLIQRLSLIQDRMAEARGILTGGAW